MTFTEFVAYYGLARSEGLRAALPHRRLPRAAPDRARDAAQTEELDDIIEWLGELVRQTDSSLLDEWEALSDPARAHRLPRRRPAAVAAALSRHRQRPRLPGDGAQRDVPARRAASPGAAGRTSPPSTRGLSAEQWQAAGEAYCGGARRRRHRPRRPRPGDAAPRRTARGRAVRVQIIDDPEGDHDWRITASVDLDASDAAGEPVLTTLSLAAYG